MHTKSRTYVISSYPQTMLGNTQRICFAGGMPSVNDAQTVAKTHYDDKQDQAHLEISRKVLIEGALLAKIDPRDERVAKY